MKSKLTEWLVKPYINEGVELDIEVGDDVLMGRFKNKRVKVKSIDWNDKGDLLINGRPALKFRKVDNDRKLLPTKKSGEDSIEPDSDRKGIDDEFPYYKTENTMHECIAFSKKFGDDIVLGKNRDRNYTPELKIVREISGNGIEVCYVQDQDTDWSEGMNSNGIGLVNSALFVKRDEKDYDKSKKKKAPSKDGIRIRHALSKDTLRDVVESLVKFDTGVKGHTIVSDGKKVVVIENTSRTKASVKIHDISNSVVRTNHGLEHPEQGYTRGPDRISSQLRLKNAQNIIDNESDYKKLFPKFYNHTQNKGPKYDVVRAQNKLWTSSQILMNLNKREMMLYLIPGAVKFIGVENKLPKGYDKKINLVVREYEHSPSDKYGTYVKTTEKPKPSAIKDKDIKVESFFGLEAKRIPRKKGQHQGSSSHSDLYTDENPKGTIHGLKFATVDDAKKSVSKIKGSGKSHAHKIQAAVAMEQRAREMGKTAQAAVYRSYINQMKKKTKEKNEGFFGLGAGDIPSPSRKMVKKMKKKGNTSVPYGSGYKKVNEQKSKIKKVIAIYPGRFQPFGPHHKKVFDALSSKFDDAYITTSNIKQPPRHPMNFNEKVRHMVKMGVPKNKIVQEKSPYVANNLLRKFDKDTTAVVYVFGAKDAGRLAGGTKKSGGKTYYQDLKSNINDLKGYEEHGYIYTAPHVNVSGISSGTEIRNLLGSPKFDEKKRQQIFKKTFGYFDQGLYNMLTNKFKKLFEFYQQPQVKKLLKEVSALGTHFNGSDLDDEGMYDFFGSIDDYVRVSPMHAEILGWELIGFPIRDTEDMMFTIMSDDYEKDRVDTTTFGRTINQNTRNTKSVDNPFPKYKEHMRNVVGNLGWEIIKFYGEESFTKMKDSPTLNKKDVYKGVDHIKDKLAEEFVEDVKKVFLIEGGAYGHMNHPFDDNNLTFSDLKNIIIYGLEGTLNREDNVSEKLDGQNLMVSWVDGNLRAARNKGHLKNGGKTAPTTAGIASMFAGRGNIKTAFVGAMKDLENAIGKLSNPQKEKIFGNGTKWMNLEVIYPQTANVIDYDVAEIIFHGTIEYDKTGRQKGYSKEAARMLQGMIQQINQNIQKRFKIGKPNFLQLNKVQDFSKKKSTFLGKLNKLQAQYGLKDNDRLGQYHESFWREYIFNAAKQFKVSLKQNELVNLTNRWAYFDKSYKVPEIKEDFKDRPEFMNWILDTDKLDHNKMWKDNIKPFEILFFQVGAEILKNIQGFLAVSPDKAVQKIKQDVSNALKDLQKPDNVEKLSKLKTQIEKLEAIGGSSAIVPSEGLVFKYNGSLYKFTGAFAPINQILGSLRF